MNQEELGPCTFVLGQDEDGEIICGYPGTSEILVRNNFALFLVVLCGRHKREHEEFYWKRRTRARGDTSPLPA